jgi:hypothetical protein
MQAREKTVRQSISLPENIAKEVRGLAKGRRLSSNRVLVELLEEGLEARKRKKREFHELAKRFRAATDAAEAERLGNELGRMIFGE